MSFTEMAGGCGGRVKVPFRAGPIVSLRQSTILAIVMTMIKATNKKEIE
jgi:hypothetical protein